MAFSEHLTVNDIIRVVKDRKKRIRQEVGREFEIDNARVRISELDQLLNYLEHDEEY